MGKKAIVAGHMCMDITPEFLNAPISRFDQIFGPGLVVDVGEAIFKPGGCVSNTGLAMNFFGADVTLMGRINEDNLGSMLLDEYKKSGAKLAIKIDHDHPSGYTIVLSPRGLDRMFLHNPGTNSYTNNDDFDKDIIREADLFHFGYPTLMPQYLKDDCGELIELFKMVKEAKTISSMDLTMPNHDSDIKNLDWDGIFRKVLPFVDVFLPSFEEIQYILDQEKYFDLYKKADGGDMAGLIDIEKDVKPLAEKLIEYGSAIVLIKCGPRGMYLRTADKNRLSDLNEILNLDLEKWADISIKQDSFVADRVLAATGAGDTSIGGFLYSLMRAEDPKSALEYAAGAGASCVTAYDSISGLISFDQMREKIDKGWQTNKWEAI